MKLDMTEEDYRRLVGRLYEGYYKGGYGKKYPSSGGSKYDKPTGWVKPSSYSGLSGAEHKAEIGKGILNLGRVNPDEIGGQGGEQGSKLMAQVFRNIVRLLVQSKGEALISDPEWVLKVLYPGAMIKTVLAADLAEALETMFDTPIPVEVKGGKVKGGFGWIVSAPALKDAIKEGTEAMLARAFEVFTEDE